MLCKIASSVYVTSSFLMLAVGGSFEGISSSEDRKAINMENSKLMQDFRSLQSEKTVSCLLSISAVCESAPQDAGLWSRKSRHPTPTPGNFDYPTPTPTPDRLRPSAVLVA